MAKHGPAPHSKAAPPSEQPARPLTTSPQAALAEKVPEDLQAVFGKNLTRARLKSGLKQSEVAEQAGLTPARISLIESGQVNLTLKTMMRLAQAVGADVSALLRKAKASLPKE